MHHKIYCKNDANNIEKKLADCLTPVVLHNSFFSLVCK